jgi:NADPH-dependent 2,4-dienoyl-CoA reductase/sulfur reductase-like enzyme
MEAARVAALQGHKVTLYEKSNELGGQLLAASQPSFKRRLKLFVEWEKNQIQKAGVVVKTNKEITADSPELENAYQIIVAIGAKTFNPPIKGIDTDKVINVMEAHLYPEKIKGEKIVVAGGGASGCDCALELAMEGKEVSIVEMMDELASNMLLDNRNPLMFRLEDYKVDQLTGYKITEITKDGVKAINKANNEKFIPADTVITAFGMKANDELAQEIAFKYPITTIIGDCDKVAQVAEAVRGGFFAGWSIH